jgi:hypothetical protein
MTISESLDDLCKEADSLGIDFEKFNLPDDEDIIVFALNYLRSNLDDAFEGLDDEDESE